MSFFLDVRGYIKKAEIKRFERSEYRIEGDKVNVINTFEFSQIKKMEKELAELKKEMNEKDLFIKSLQDSIELKKLEFDKSNFYDFLLYFLFFYI